MLVFTNNCVAAEIYKYCIDMPFQQPLMWTSISLKDMANIIKNFSYSMLSDVAFQHRALVKLSNCPYARIANQFKFKELLCPSASNSVFTAYFKHSHCRHNCSSSSHISRLQTLYVRRLSRLKAQLEAGALPVFLVQVFDYSIRYDFDAVVELLQLETKFKLFFSFQSEHALSAVQHCIKHPCKVFNFDPTNRQTRQYAAKCKFEWMINLA